MQIVRDPVEIFEKLSAENQWPGQFDRSLVFHFVSGDDRVFVVFEQLLRQFRLFILSDHLAADWEKLIAALQDLYDDGFTESLINEAILEASAVQLQHENGRRYFDAH